MLQHDKTIEESKVENDNILVSRKSCKETIKVLKDLQFVLGGTEIIIRPQGYTYQLPGMTDCFIGVSSIPDSFNQYRLGTIFLRNFYTGLNFETQEIMLGLNEGTDTADMIGKSESKKVKNLKPRGGGLIFISFFMLVILTIAMVCYCRNKKIQEERQ